jgi:hypothetical protein
MRPSYSSASSFSDESSCLVQVMDASGIWLMTIRGQKCGFSNGQTLVKGHLIN